MRETREVIEPKTYYSRSKGLMICASHGRLESMDGESKRVGEKHIQFGPAGVESDFGIFRTADTELIEYLDERVETVKDVFGAEEYNRLIIPADVRAGMLERQLQDANRLIALLKDRGVEPATAKG